MLPEDSRALKVGDRVYWMDDRQDMGSIVARDWAGVTIKWDNTALPVRILHNDMAKVTKVQPLHW